MTIEVNSRGVDGSGLPAPYIVARQLHRDLNLRGTPVDVLKVARLLGLQVEHDSGIGRHGKLGLVGGRLTAILGDAEPVEQRYALAHELGHYLLYVQHQVPLRSQTGRASIERFCDSFAAHLLVPDSAITASKSAWSRSDRTTLRAIARVAERTAAPLAATSRVYLEATGWQGTVLI